MSRRTSRLVLALCLLIANAAAGQNQPSGITVPPAAATSSPQAPPLPVWPRTYSNAGNSIVIYQPQVDAWKDYAKIRFRSAVEVTPKGGQTNFGVLAVQGDTLVDDTNRTVLITNLDGAARFPGLSDAQAAPLKAMVKQLMPSVGYFDVSLDQVLAYQHDDVKPPVVNVNLSPPPIFYSDSPAILVNYIGPPQFKPVPGTPLTFAVNTNWVVLMDPNSSQYYLLDGNSWLTAPDPVNGPWTAATQLPASFSNLPSEGNWADVSAHVPGVQAASVPRVITSTQPAELIVTDGPPDYAPIANTSLMYVSNPVMPLFLDITASNYYYLVAGRWFSAQNLAGPWTAASSNLPAEFAKIPADSPLAFVLASVPNTQEAKDAVLLAQVPHKATININNTTVNVSYDGTPNFVPIQGTTMQYATNTSYQVVSAQGRYYCCYQGVWFLAPASTGPWAVCTSVPAVIYTIPPSNPLYNVTYVKVYDSTPSTVVVGYTGGYSGEYVAATGALMFGAGMLTGALIAGSSDCCWYGWNSCYYSYGCAAHYSYGYGGYYRAGGARTTDPAAARAGARHTTPPPEPGPAAVPSTAPPALTGARRPTTPSPTLMPPTPAAPTAINPGDTATPSRAATGPRPDTNPARAAPSPARRTHPANGSRARGARAATASRGPAMAMSTPGTMATSIATTMASGRSTTAAATGPTPRGTGPAARPRKPPAMRNPRATGRTRCRIVPPAPAPRTVGRTTGTPASGKATGRIAGPGARLPAAGLPLGAEAAICRTVGASTTT